MIMGSRLKELRKSKMMSQAQLGEILDVSKVSVSGYESGNRVPSMDIFIKILDVFGVSSDFLLGREIGMVCENNQDDMIWVSKDDIEIIKTIKSKNEMYTTIIKNPKRFFSMINDKIFSMK